MLMFVVLIVVFFVSVCFNRTSLDTREGARTEDVTLLQADEPLFEHLRLHVPAGLGARQRIRMPKGR